MRKGARKPLLICMQVLLAAVLLLFLPSDTHKGLFAQKSINPAKDEDPCDQFPGPPGKANGIEKRCFSGGGSSGIPKADFNGDGVADLAIGVPGEETPAGVPASGAVNVIYGSRNNGLTTTDSSAITMVSPILRLEPRLRHSLITVLMSGDRSPSFMVQPLV